MIIFRTVFAALFLLAAIPAQPLCIGDDGFDTGCCLLPSPTIPNFPPINISADYAALLGCGAVGFNTTGTAQFSAPSFFFSDYATMSVSITLPGAGQVNGVILAKYARTWMDVGTTGVLLQVWRFLVNGDLAWTSLGGAGSYPPVAGAPYFGLVHMMGHIDYACDPGISVNNVQPAFSLSVLPGCIGHASWSGAPIAGLAGGSNSYHVVGPAPFTWGGASEPQGVIGADSSRMSRFNWSPLIYTPLSEAKVGTGNLVTNFGDCLLAPSNSPRPWKHQTLSAVACCSGVTFTPTISSLPLLGTPIPTGFATLPLGNWNAPPGQFPDTRSLSFHIGVLVHQYPCAPVFLPLHAVTGVTTSNHLGTPFQSTVSLCSAPAGTFFSHWMDLQNMWLTSLFPNKIPSLGSLFASDLVISLNI